MRKIFLSLAGQCVLAGAAQMSLAATQYNVVYLGAFSPAAVNASGQVVGTQSSFTTGNKGYLYSGGTLTPLGSLGGGQTVAAAINDSGMIGGYSTTSSNATHAFVANGSTFTDVGVLPGGTTSYGTALSNSGQLVGYGTTTTSFSPYHAFRYDSANGLQDLGVIPGGTTSRAYAINSLGEIAGDANGSGRPIHAMTIAPGSSTITDIGSLNNSNAATQSTAYGVNSSGTVVGSSQTSPTSTFFPSVYTPGSGAGSGMVNVALSGSAGGELDGINGSGQAVGYSFDSTNTNVAILYSGGVTSDLNTLISPTSGWTLTGATAISSTGYIVGVGTYNGTSNVAFELVPVPEPASLGLLGIAGGLFRRRHRA